MMQLPVVVVLSMITTPVALSTVVTQLPEPTVAAAALGAKVGGSMESRLKNNPNKRDLVVRIRTRLIK